MKPGMRGAGPSFSFDIPRSCVVVPAKLPVAPTSLSRGDLIPRATSLQRIRQDRENQGCGTCKPDLRPVAPVDHTLKFYNVATTSRPADTQTYTVLQYLPLFCVCISTLRHTDYHTFLGRTWLMPVTLSSLFETSEELDFYSTFSRLLVVAPSMQ